MAADSFFKQGSAELDIEETRDILIELAKFLSATELLYDQDGNLRKFRIEGHTDSSLVADNNHRYPLVKIKRIFTLL